MKRYIFLLLAFFLANNVHAEGLISGVNPSMGGAAKLANVNSTPDLRSNVNNPFPDASSRNDRVPSATNNIIPSATTVPGIENGVDSIPDTGITPAVRARNSNAARARDIRRTSPRNTAEIGSTMEPAVSGSRTPDDQFNNSGNGARSAETTGTTKTSSKGMSCKTYEGRTYDQGEAGYSDCMRNIRTDRQGTRTVP